MSSPGVWNPMSQQYDRPPLADNRTVICHRCGRVGTRGYVISSGNGDGTRDTYACANDPACERRQRKAPL